MNLGYSNTFSHHCIALKTLLFSLSGRSDAWVNDMLMKSCVRVVVNTNMFKNSGSVKTEGNENPGKCVNVGSSTMRFY